MKKKVAIFDIDGTIFRSSLLIELVELLIQREIFPPSARKVYQKTHRSWLARTGSYEEYINDVISVFETHLKGVSYEDFITAAKDVVEEKKDHVYLYTRDMVKKLKKDGYFLLAISQSPKGILDEFCKELGFDKVYGRFYELGPTDLFTGETVDMHLIGNKANIVKRAVEKENLTLEGSVGVGDTEGDIPLLEMVDDPICFNPNSSLYKIAKINNWKVVIERKDVIYKIQ
ncbi:MAG: HAD-IB family hydrolase [Candidatus Pacebacteria bacterium]|nr:HAD-IB family hydrolase [Candidatus Paceibacterota bacterium]